MTRELHSDAVVVLPVTPDRLADLIALFERPGPRGGKPIPGHCWCMGWRDPKLIGPARKEAMCSLVRDDRQPGLLAYDGDVPVGWVSIAPRRDYAQLQRSKMLDGRRIADAAASGSEELGPDAEEGDVYSIVCFHVDRSSRGQGVSSALLDGAIEFARQRGASVIEAYPHSLEMPPHVAKSKLAEQNANYMGRLEAFERRGFVRVRDTRARVVVQLKL